MKITREDLKNMYLEHIEAEKVRLEKLLEEEFNIIVREILNENKLGRFSYQKKCYEYSEMYLTSLLTRLQEVFVDSKIQTAFITNDGPQKYVLVKIEWA
jgi:hypothetical protein